MGNLALLLGSHHPPSQKTPRRYFWYHCGGRVEVVDDRDIDLNKGREEQDWGRMEEWRKYLEQLEGLLVDFVIYIPRSSSGVGHEAGF